MAEHSDPSITDLLRARSHGDASANERLWELLYDELRTLARRCLSSERRNHTLQPTALVHEAYLRLVDQQQCSWRNRNHFKAIAARTMRRVLVDHARRRGRQKRGSGATMLRIDAVADLPRGATAEVVLVDDALKGLEAVDPFKASLVELRFFGGLTHAEVAEVLDCSEVTVRRHWPVAKAWLRIELQGGSHGR